MTAIPLPHPEDWWEEEKKAKNVDENARYLLTLHPLPLCPSSLGGRGGRFSCVSTQAGLALSHPPALPLSVRCLHPSCLFPRSLPCQVLACQFQLEAWLGWFDANTSGENPETDEQLCQVDFAPLGKGNLCVGEKKNTTRLKRQGGFAHVIVPGPHVPSPCLPPLRNCNCQLKY